MRADIFNTVTAILPISHRESDNDYQAVVVQLNERWRVIVCKDGIQWILQFAKKRRGGVEWTSRSYLRGRDALFRVSHDNAGETTPNAVAILEALPRMIGIGGAK